MGTPLVDMLHFPRGYHSTLTGMLSFVIFYGAWQISPELSCHPEVVADVESSVLLLFPLPNKLVWMHSTDSLLSAKSAFQFQFMHSAPALIYWSSVI